MQICSVFSFLRSSPKKKCAVDGCTGKDSGRWKVGGSAQPRDPHASAQPNLSGTSGRNSASYGLKLAAAQLEQAAAQLGDGNVVTARAHRRADDERKSRRRVCNKKWSASGGGSAEGTKMLVEKWWSKVGGVKWKTRRYRCRQRRNASFGDVGNASVSAMMMVVPLAA